MKQGWPFQIREGVLMHGRGDTIECCVTNFEDRDEVSGQYISHDALPLIGTETFDQASEDGSAHLCSFCPTRLQFRRPQAWRIVPWRCSPSLVSGAHTPSTINWSIHSMILLRDANVTVDSHIEASVSSGWLGRA